MLPHSHRLPASEIPRVMKFGKRLSAQGITLAYTKERQETINNKQLPRFSFIVSTKVNKRAVVRNRMRRILSESVRHLMNRIALDIDGVFIGSRQLVGLNQKEVEGRVVEILVRAEIFVE